jgi:hypothetical protein
VGTALSWCGKAEAEETEEEYRWSATDFAPQHDIAVVWYAFYDFGEQATQ